VTRPVDIGRSVAARLLNRAKATGDDYQRLLTAYALERFLYRVGVSPIRDRFVLKGAMLLRVWADQPYRATRDLDLLRRGDGSFAAVTDDLRIIITSPASADGVEFDAESIHVESIRAAEEYAGTRAKLASHCGTARLTLQIDMGLGDSVWPPPKNTPYPALLEFPPPVVMTYPREAVVAEKLEAIVVLADSNSRIKDFFDIHYLATRFEFDRTTLAEAVRRTFERRNTPIPTSDPIGLTIAYWQNPLRPAHVRAFARRASISVQPAFAGDIARVLGEFLLPVLNDLRVGTEARAIWPPGGPWR
jgi:hypothetical protein